MANGAILGQSTTTWTNDQILSSVSAALYSLGANATPDQVFAAIRPLITTAQNSANNAQSAANTAQQAANNASAAASTAQNTANNALSTANGRSMCVSGTYTGNAPYSGEYGSYYGSQFINLGFTPKFVVAFKIDLVRYGGMYNLMKFGVATIDSPLVENLGEPTGYINILKIETNGFYVGSIYISASSSNTYVPALNDPGVKYCYAVFS